ncbi:MAG: ferredoxin family protein [Planctomycetaceae bacterium]|nr:ferredoxin family protein [Planctomycetaceae bacterium]
MISAVQDATCTVVISRGQSRNPQKRGLEQGIADEIGKLKGVNVLTIPHLYDLPKTSDSYQKLSQIEGDLIVVSWIYSRAAHWILDRNGIQGQVGIVEIGNPDDDDSDDVEIEQSNSGAADPESESAEPVVDRVTDLYPRPDRKVHCVDLKVENDPQVFITEIKRILGVDVSSADTSLPIVGGQLVQVEEQTSRRWYPVIDFSRCTNCMECVDFCLFGVYGVDGTENILVEQPDNCRKGCPACSRVCPANAIIFPQHKAPAIAGAETEGDEGFKIDLSQLFGAPNKNEDPIETAARERDEQLLLAGRDTIGIDEQLKKRQADLSASPKDGLDRLIDSLDEFDL